MSKEKKNTSSASPDPTPCGTLLEYVEMFVLAAATVRGQRSFDEQHAA